MRKFTLCLAAVLCLFVSNNLFAQTQSVEERFIEAISDLDMTAVQSSTNIFYDKVPALIPLYLFSGDAVDDSIIGSSSGFLIAYNTMHHAYLSGSPLLEADSIISIMDEYEASDTVMIASLLS